MKKYLSGLLCLFILLSVSFIEINKVSASDLSTTTTVVVNPSGVTNVSMVGSPTLNLSYDGSARESKLTATFNVSVQAGNQGVVIYKNGGYAHLVDQNGKAWNTNSESSPVFVPSSTLQSSTDQNGRVIYTIPAGKTVKFTATWTAYPKELFEGKYYATLGAIGIQSDLGGIQVPANKTNTRMIIGELSPYISSGGTSADATTGVVTVTVNGVRFLSGDTVYFDNVLVKPTVFNSKKIVFVTNNPATDSSHSIQIKDSRFGASNIAYVFISTPTNPPVSVLPVATITNSPTLKLTYDLKRKESLLTANFKGALISNGTYIPLNPLGVNFVNSISGNSSSIRSAVTTYTLVDSTGATPKMITVDGIQYYNIPVGKTFFFDVTTTVKPIEMFAGSYYARLFGSWLPILQNTIQVLPGDKVSNKVTIVGETSPYISNISPQINNDGTKVLGIYGARLLNSTPVVTCGSSYPVGSNVDGMKNSNEKVFFNIKTLPSGTTCQVYLQNPNTGSSNTGIFTVPGVTATANYTLIGTPTLTKSVIGQTASSSFLASFVFDISAVGGDVIVSPTNAFKIGIFNSNNTQLGSDLNALYDKPISGVTTDSKGNYVITEGNSARFTIQSVFVAPSGSYPAGSLLRAQMKSATVTAGTVMSVSIMSDNFRTGMQVTLGKSENQNAATALIGFDSVLKLIQALK